jgi:hypothetical protein
MAGRRRKSGGEEFLDFLAASPWWMGLVCAVVAFVFLWFVVPAVVQAGPSPDEVSHRPATDLLSMLSRGLAWPAAVMIALLGLVAKGVRFLIGEADSTPTGKDGTRRSGGDDPATTACPQCHAPMVRKTARRGRHAGEPFWSCSRFPQCRGKRAMDE